MIETADTFAYAIQQPEGQLVGYDRQYGPELWLDEKAPARHIEEFTDTFAGCTVVKVRITTDLGEAP
jgi:hypothetical protein